MDVSTLTLEKREIAEGEREKRKAINENTSTLIPFPSPKINKYIAGDEISYAPVAMCIACRFFQSFR